jgi:hypothetical protein
MKLYQMRLAGHRTGRSQTEHAPRVRRSARRRHSSRCRCTCSAVLVYMGRWGTASRFAPTTWQTGTARTLPRGAQASFTAFSSLRFCKRLDVVVTVLTEVAFQDVGSSADAFSRRKPFTASSTPAATQRSMICPPRHRLTFRFTSRVRLMRLSTALVVASAGGAPIA